MLNNRGFLFALALSSVSLLASTGCGPTYPKCEDDKHCAEKGEFCLNGTCQQCRDNTHCQGPGMMCSGGKCVRQPGYCDDSVPCPGNQKCRNNQCGPQCLANDECSGNTYCRNGSCIQKPECGEGADSFECPGGQECIGGRCEIKLASCGGGEPVYFDFDKFNIRADQRGKIDGIAGCLKQGNASNLTVEGHCDERGTEEYNLALGENRANSVQRYLENLGVSPGKLRSVSYGKNRPAVQGSNASAWSKNRRVEFR